MLFNVELLVLSNPQESNLLLSVLEEKMSVFSND